MSLIEKLPPRKDGLINAVIETPQGSRNKYSYDPDTGLYTLARVLPAGSQFPFSFGFIPRTLAEDGDPLDVLILADEPVPVGCVVPSRLIGVFEATQKSRERNDRLVAVAAEARNHQHLRSLRDLNATLVREVECFLQSYHEFRREIFKIVGRGGPSRAKEILEEGEARYERKQSESAVKGWAMARREKDDETRGSRGSTRGQERDEKDTMSRKTRGAHSQARSKKPAETGDARTTARSSARWSDDDEDEQARPKIRAKPSRSRSKK